MCSAETGNIERKDFVLVYNQIVIMNVLHSTFYIYSHAILKWNTWGQRIKCFVCNVMAACLWKQDEMIISWSPIPGTYRIMIFFPASEIHHIEFTHALRCFHWPENDCLPPSSWTFCRVWVIANARYKVHSKKNVTSRQQTKSNRTKKGKGAFWDIIILL